MEHQLLGIAEGELVNTLSVEGDVKQIESSMEDSGTKTPANGFTELPSFPLAKARQGDRLEIVALNCGEGNSRLMAMGLMPGRTLEIMSSATTGAVMVAMGDHRLGLGLEMAEKIQVAPSNFLKFTNPLTPMQTTSDKTSIKLQSAVIGSTLKVVGYEPTARDYKRKLLSMGLTPGTELIVKRHAPLGDPTEIEVRGFHLSLRKGEADSLIVTLKENQL